MIADPEKKIQHKLINKLHNRLLAKSDGELKISKRNALSVISWGFRIDLDMAGDFLLILKKKGIVKQISPGTFEVKRIINE